MTRIETETVTTAKSQEEVFAFLTDLNNLEKLMPSQVTNWKSTTETCSFTLGGMATVGMRIAGSTPHSLINLVSDGGKIPFSFTLDIHIGAAPEGSGSTGKLLFQADINPFLRPMVETPLRNFFNMLVGKLKDLP
jgi:hypothetical protein